MTNRDSLYFVYFGPEVAFILSYYSIKTLPMSMVTTTSMVGIAQGFTVVFEVVHTYQVLTTKEYKIVY
jgi:hypothetical protein